MKKISPLSAAVHLYAWSALAVAVFDLATGNLSANPIQDLEQRTGRHAATLLILSLACAPLNALFKWSEPLKHRRALGLYALMYAAIHALVFADLDYGLAWNLLPQTVFQKPYLLVGAAAFLLLLPLGATSFDVWKQRLGKNWKRLHRAVYFIAPLVILHYAWSKKGDLFSLQGDMTRPALYGLVLLILLALRLPPARKFAARIGDSVKRFRAQKAASRPSPAERR